MEHLTILDPLDIRVRVDELKLLQIGWLDGNGISPPQDGLDWLADSFDTFYPDDIPLPYLFPTTEGRVLSEWSLKPWSPSLEIDLAKKRGEWHAVNLDTDEESTRGIDLSKADDWTWLAEQIRTMGGEAE